MKSIEARADFDPVKEVPSLEGKVLFITGGMNNSFFPSYQKRLLPLRNCWNWSGNRTYSGSSWAFAHLYHWAKPESCHCTHQ